MGGRQSRSNSLPPIPDAAREKKRAEQKEGRRRSQSEIRIVMDTFDLQQGSVAELHTIYTQYCSDKEMGLACNEFVQLLLDTMPPGDHPEDSAAEKERKLRARFEKLDGNGDGFLDFQELSAMIFTKKARNSSDPLEKQAFTKNVNQIYSAVMQIFDANQDGEISFEELSNMTRVLLFKGGHDTSEKTIAHIVNMVFEACDTDKSGTLSALEVRCSIEKDPTLFTDLLALAMK